MLNQYRYNVAEIEVFILGLLGKVKEIGQLYDSSAASDKGMTEAEISSEAPEQFGGTARRKALASLVEKREIVRDDSRPGRKPYRITAKGELRLKEWRDRVQQQAADDSEREANVSAEPRPSDDDPKAMGWLARKYAEAMFPNNPDPKDRKR